MCKVKANGTAPVDTLASHAHLWKSHTHTQKLFLCSMRVCMSVVYFVFRRMHEQSDFCVSILKNTIIDSNETSDWLTFSSNTLLNISQKWILFDVRLQMNTRIKKIRQTANIWSDWTRFNKWNTNNWANCNYYVIPQWLWIVLICWEAGERVRLGERVMRTDKKLNTNSSHYCCYCWCVCSFFSFKSDSLTIWHIELHNELCTSYG